MVKHRPDYNYVRPVAISRLTGWIPPFAVFAAFLALYVKTMAPSIFWGDSAAFAASNYILGLPHSPSFPLYTILGRLFNLLPGLAPAFASNLMSAFFAALAVMMFFKITRRLVDVPIFLPDEYKRFLANRKAAEADQAVGKDVVIVDYMPVLKPLQAFIPTLAVTILFGLTLPVWLSAVRAEVYSLHLFLSLAAVYFCLIGTMDEKRKIYLLGFWIYALSFANHPLLALCFAPAFIYLGIINFSLFGRAAGTSAVIGTFFIMAFTVYFYLPFRAVFDPSINWGRPDTLDAFLAAITRSGGTVTFSEMMKTPDYLLRFKNVGLFLVGQIGWPLVGLTLIGLVGLYRILGKTAFIFPIAIIINLAIVLWAADFNYKNYDMINYTAPLMALILIVGVAGAMYFFRQITPPKHSAVLFTVVLIAFSAVAVEKNYIRADMSEVTGAEIICQEALKDLPSGSIILAAEDNVLLPLWYGAYVDSVAENIAILSPGAMVNTAYRKQVTINYPDLEYPAGFSDTLPISADSLARAICLLNRDKRNIYVQYGVPGISHLELVPSGILFKFVGAGEKPAINKDFYNRHIKLVEQMLSGNPYETKTVDFCARWLFTIGVYCDRHGSGKMAWQLFDQALDIDRSNIDMRLKLAEALTRNHRYTEALKFVSEALDIDSQNPASLKLGQSIVRKMENEVASR